MAKKTAKQMRGEMEPHGDWLREGEEAMKRKILKDCPRCKRLEKLIKQHMPCTCKDKKDRTCLTCAVLNEGD